MLREFQLLEGIRDARRAAAYLCQITAADFKRPLGVLSTSIHLRSRLSLGWPRLETLHDKLVYTGPLPVACYCGRSHSPMIGTTDSDDFITSLFSTLGTNFWNLCVFDETLEARDISLRDGATTDLAPLKLVGIDPLLSPSLASRVGSLRSVYDAWKMGNLTASMLADIAGAQGYTAFMAASSLHRFSLLSSPCSSLCSLWKVTAVPASDAPLQASSVSTSLPISSPPCFLSPRVRSRSSSRLKRPLVHLRPRGDGGSHLVAGASRGSLSARCFVLLVSLCQMIIFTFVLS